MKNHTEKEDYWEENMDETVTVIPSIFDFQLPGSRAKK